MFYQNEHSQALRLGDVVEGFVSSQPVIEAPNTPTTRSERIASVNIGLPTFSVVLSPCCSIDDEVVCLTPLIQLNNKMLTPPYFRDDPTRINSEVEPEKSVPPELWISPDFQEKKRQLLAVGPAYRFGDYFVYDKNELFPPYTVNMRGQPNIATNYYMIDFRNIYSLKCSKIKRDSKQEDKDLLIKSKKLELSVETRYLLRLKLSYYFYRPAPEDEAVIRSAS